MPLGDERRSRKESDGSIFFHFQFNKNAGWLRGGATVKRKTLVESGANKGGFCDTCFGFFGL